MAQIIAFKYKQQAVVPTQQWDGWVIGIGDDMQSPFQIVGSIASQAEPELVNGFSEGILTGTISYDFLVDTISFPK